MRRFLAAQFAPVLRAWRNGYEAEVRRAAIAFFLLVFLAFGVCLAVPELRLGFSAYLQHLFQGMDLTGPGTSPRFCCWPTICGPVPSPCSMG